MRVRENEVMVFYIDFSFRRFWGGFILERRTRALCVNLWLIDVLLAKMAKLDKVVEMF